MTVRDWCLRHEPQCLGISERLHIIISSVCISTPSESVVAVLDCLYSLV